MRQKLIIFIIKLLVCNGSLAVWLNKLMLCSWSQWFWVWTSRLLCCFLEKGTLRIFQIHVHFQVHDACNVHNVHYDALLCQLALGFAWIPTLLEEDILEDHSYVLIKTTDLPCLQHRLLLVMHCASSTCNCKVIILQKTWKFCRIHRLLLILIVILTLILSVTDHNPYLIPILIVDLLCRFLHFSSIHFYGTFFADFHVIGFSVRQV